MSINRKNLYYDTDSGFEFITKPIEDSVIIRETNNGYIVKYLDKDTDPDFEWSDIETNNSVIILCYDNNNFYIDRPDIISKDDLILYFQDSSKHNFEKGLNIKKFIDSKYYVFPLRRGKGNKFSLSLLNFINRWDANIVGLC